MYRMPGRIQKAFQFGSGFLLSIDPHYIECPRWWRPCKRRVLSSLGNFENKLLLDFRWLLRSLLFVDFQQFHFGTLRSKCPGRWGALGNMVPEQKEFGVRSSYCSVEGMERCGYVLLESKAGILNFPLWCIGTNSWVCQVRKFLNYNVVGGKENLWQLSTQRPEETPWRHAHQLQPSPWRRTLHNKSLHSAAAGVHMLKLTSWKYGSEISLRDFLQVQIWSEQIHETWRVDDPRMI